MKKSVPASVLVLLVLLLFPASSRCKEDVYKSQAKSECCEGVHMKRFDDIDYNSFVSLMGRRSAAQTNSRRRRAMSRKRRVDLTLADLLWQPTRDFNRT